MDAFRDEAALIVKQQLFAILVWLKMYFPQFHQRPARTQTGHNYKYTTKKIEAPPSRRDAPHSFQPSCFRSRYLEVGRLPSLFSHLLSGVTPISCDIGNQLYPTDMMGTTFLRLNV